MRWRFGRPVIEQIGDMARQLHIEHLAQEGREDERPAPEDDDMMQRRVHPTAATPKPVYSWVFESSRATAGARVSYTTELFPGGELRCNCPGWVYKRKNAVGCKHTEQVRGEVPTILQMIKDGAALPVISTEKPKAGFLPQEPQKPKAVSTTNDDENDIKYGRKIEV